MKRYNLAQMYFLGKRKDGERKQEKYEGKALVYYDTVTEYFDLPEDEAQEFVGDYNDLLSGLHSQPMILVGEYPHWDVEVDEELLEKGNWYDL